MTSRPSRETVMTALYNALVAGLKLSFTANTASGSAVLGSPSSIAGLFIGMPVFGVGIPRKTFILTLTPTLTLTEEATANATAVQLYAGVRTVGRRFIFLNKVPEQPAMFLRKGNERLEYAETSLQMQTMRAEVWLASNFGKDPEFVPETPLNNLLDAMQYGVFAPDNPQTNTFTLGGLVYWCRISGEIEVIPGDLDGQAVAIADVEIIVP
jgi:hypothetical protein